MTALLLAISRASRSGDKPGPGAYIAAILLTIPVIFHALLPISNHEIMSDIFRIWVRMNPDNPFWEPEVHRDPGVHWDRANLERIYNSFVQVTK